MDTPTPIPPATNAIDEKLLKRASHAGRNLSLLAILASCGAVGLIFAAFSAKGIHGVMTVLAATITLIAAGYWVLAVAAKRGNPNAVGIVIVAMVLQICLALIMAGVTAARTNTPFQPPTTGIFIPILVLISLANSRKVLLQLKERNLWDQVFASAKPSRDLCFIGGILLVTGFIAMNVGSNYIVWKAGQARTTEIQHAKAFVEMIQGDEKEFYQAMRGISANPGPQAIATALAKIKSLEQKSTDLQNQAVGESQLLQILGTYGNAVHQWKNGLLIMQESNPDTERAEKMLKLGDKLRKEAGEDFDHRYAPKK